MEITLDRAVELIEEKRSAASNNTIKTFDERPDVLVLKGRFGPYLKIGKDNFKIPKTAVPEDLPLEECIALSEVKPEKKVKGNAKRKK